MSKGDRRRPTQVSEAEAQANWERIFNKLTKKPKKDKKYHYGVEVK